MSNIIEIETQNNLQYVFFPIASSCLRFKVKATNDAHIALTKGSYESNPMTELHIGGWDNTKSIVRRNQSEPDKVKVETPGILNRNEYVGMWIRWYNSCVVAGLEGTETPFMVYEDPHPHPIDHAAVRTGWGSTGSWKIEVSPVILRTIAPKRLPADLRWVPMSTEDMIPDNAVIGGHEVEVTFVARALHNRSMCPGKYVPSMKCALVPWGHQAHRKTSFEILCGDNLAWVPTSGDVLPPHAFPGGHSAERHNEVLYIGRAYIDKNLVPGKVHLHYKTCYLPYQGREREVHSYEVLVVPELPKQLAWRRMPRRRNSSSESD